MSKTQAGARVSPGAVWLLYTEAGLVFALFLFASIVSFSGLYSIASWVGLPPVLYWALPLAIDFGIIVYKIAEVVLRYDDRKTKKVKKAVFGTLLFTTISSAGNIIHVAALADADPLHYWGGIAMAALMPWAVYLSASVLADLIVKPYRVPAAQSEPVAAAQPAKATAPRKAPARPRQPRTKPVKQPAPKPLEESSPPRGFEPVTQTIRPFDEAWNAR